MSNHLKPIEPLTIETIRTWEWCGNAHSDGPAFASIDKFVLDTTKPVADRGEAIRIMGKEGMGLKGEDAGDHMTDEQLVDEWFSMTLDAQDEQDHMPRECRP